MYSRKAICFILASCLLFMLSSAVLAAPEKGELKAIVFSDSLQNGPIACNPDDQQRVVIVDDGCTDNTALVVQKDYYDLASETNKESIKAKILGEFNNKKEICFMGDASNLDPVEILSIFGVENNCAVLPGESSNDELIAVVYRLDEVGRPRLTAYYSSKDRAMSDEEKLSFVLNNNFECLRGDPAVLQIESVYGSTRMVCSVVFECSRAATIKQHDKRPVWDVKITSQVKPLGSYRVFFVKNRISQHDFQTYGDEVLMDYWPTAYIFQGVKTFDYFITDQPLYPTPLWYTKTWGDVDVFATSNEQSPADNIEIVYDFSGKSVQTLQTLVSGFRWWNQSGDLDIRYHCTFCVGDEVKEIGQNISIPDA